MGKASSSKKVARAARAGGSRRAGQRRNLGFPATIAGVLIVGLLLVFATRADRIANAAPRVNSDHWHVPFDTYTCVPDASTPVTPPPTTTTVPQETSTTAPASSTASSTATTATTTPAASGSGLGLEPAGHLAAPQQPTTTSTTSTTAPPDTTPTTAPVATTTTTTTLVAQPGDVPGVYQAHFQDAAQDVNGIHTHGDGVIHVHPFNASSAGRSAQLKVFMAQVAVKLTDTELSFTDPATGQLLTYKEGTTKCQGGKEGIVQIGLWDKVADAANGKPPNQVITSNVGDVRLKNGHALTIAFLPKDSRIPIQSDVKKRFDNLTDVTATTTTTTPASESSSGGEPSSGGASTTAPATSSSSGSSASSSSSSSSSSG